MKKILIICVNYNSYDALHVFLESIDCAAKKVTQSMEIHVAIADNSSDIQEIEESVYPDIHIGKYVTKQNLGYLGGARFTLNKISETDYNGYDYIAISNVDVTLDPSFFAQLETINLSNVGWIAPSIISHKENKDRNPKILTRPSKRHLQLTRLPCNNAYDSRHRIHLQQLQFLQKEEFHFSYAACLPSICSVVLQE